MTTKTEQAEARAHARRVLDDLLDDGQRIGTVTIHGRGMTDWVECFVPSKSEPGMITRITYYVAQVTGLKMTERGIARGGAQYDKAADVVDSLSRALYGEGGHFYRDRLLG